MTPSNNTAVHCTRALRAREGTPRRKRRGKRGKMRRRMTEGGMRERRTGETIVEKRRRTIEKRKGKRNGGKRSEEHTSELQSLMRISYGVLCMQKKHTQNKQTHENEHGQRDSDTHANIQRAH